MVRNAGVEIACHALDLAAPPAGVLAQVRALAARLAADTGDPAGTAPSGGIAGVGRAVTGRSDAHASAPERFRRLGSAA